MKIFFTDPPRGAGVTEKDDSNREQLRSSFTGRVYLQQDYSSNAADDVSLNLQELVKLLQYQYQEYNWSYHRK